MSKTRRQERDGIYRRPDSPNYWASYIDASGKRTRRSTGASNKEEATALLAKWRVEAREQKHWGAKPAREFEVMILTYLKEVSAHKRSFKTDKVHARKLRNFFAGRDCNLLTQADRRDYVSGRRSAGLSNATINRELSLLSASIKHVNQQYDWGIENICSGARLPEPPKSIRWLRESEADALIEAAAALPRAIGLADFITISLHTGMRCHELLFEVVEGVEVGLTWDRVDFHNNLLYLDSEHQKNGRVSSVPLNSIAIEALRSRAKFRSENCPDARYVFCNREGSGIKSMKRSFATACRNAGIEKIRIHDLRHTCASWLVQRGVPIVKVKELLRHSDIATTMRYAHLAPCDSREAVSALESRFSHVTKHVGNYRGDEDVVNY